MLRKTDLFAIITIFAVVFCGCLWWQDLERRAAQAGEPVGDVPRLNLAPKVPPREPVKGFCEVRIGAGEYAKRHGYERAKGKMAALPGGYVRVQRGGSETVSVSGAGTMKVRANLTGGTLTETNMVSIGAYQLHGVAVSYPVGHGVLFVLKGPGVTPDELGQEVVPGGRVVENYTGAGGVYWSGEREVTYSLGPLILGVKYECPAPPEGGPAFSYKHGSETAHWFATPSTALTVSCGEFSQTTYPYAVDTDLGPWIGGFGWGSSIWDAPNNYGKDIAIHTNLSIAGWDVDTGDLLNGCLKGMGGGECRTNTDYGTGLGGVAWIAPPVTVHYDMRITKFGKHIWDGARLIESALYAEKGLSIQTPYVATHVYPIASWTVGGLSGLAALTHTVDLDTTWMAAQDPPLPTSDIIVPIQGTLPNPPAGRTDYDAIQLDIAPEIECHRPDGVKLSNYINTDGKITVSEGASETTFAVNAAGGTVKRTLVRQWDHYFDPTDPDFTFDLCRKTKHVTAEVVPGTGNVTGEDIYGWNTYAYMDLVFRCPVACTVTMAVSAVHYAVFDTYTLPMSERRANYEAIPIDASQEYTFSLEARPNEDQTVRINLLFPDAGGPAYLGRVTAVEFRGFGVGTIILKSQKLISATEESGEHAGEYYPYYVKVAPGPPVQRGKYSFVGISHDGSPVVMLTPDTAYKPNEVLGQGGNLRYCEPLTSSVEGVGPLDWQVDIGTVAAWLNALEGVTATHQTAAAESALGDGDAEIGPENADWLIPVYPVAADDSLDRRFVPGTPAMLAARPMCRTLGITNAVEWEIKVDHALMFGIEVQAKTGNEPAPEGVVMQAYYMDGEDKRVDATARGVTDQNGYCVVAPIPADESREYDVEQAA